MSAPTVEHRFAYLAPSSCVPTPSGAELHLATSGGSGAHPRLFAGEVAHAGVQATALLVVAATARARFFDQGWRRFADPVITCHADRLRFESLSSCAGVYARHDADLAGGDGTVLHPGVTNVDVGADTRELLGRVVAGGPLHLDVGTEGVAVSTDGATAVERRVQIPVRWVKGFGEVAAAQRALDQRLQFDGPAAQRFLRTVPRAGRSLHLVPGPREPRWSTVAAPGSIVVNDPGRLKLLAPLVRHARSIVVRGGATGITSWQVDTPAGRTHLVLSPASTRGFSGEGRSLTPLAADGLAAVADAVADELAWQPILDPEALGRRVDERTADVDASLDVLAVRGQLGFDAATGAFFHRDLPYDLGRVEALHPRLAAARRIVDDGGVRLTPDGHEAWVTTRASEHRVRLTDTPPACSCTWWARYRSSRGPCKHVLAAQLALGGPQAGDTRSAADAATGLSGPTPD